MSYWICPTFHPAHILRKNRKLEGLLQRDLRRAVDLTNGNWKPKWNEQGVGYKLAPSADEVVAILDAMAGKEVAYDIETNGEHPCSKALDIRCCGFWDGAKGICVPWLKRDGFELRDVFDKQGRKKRKQKSFAIWKPYFSGAALEKVNAAVQRLFTSARVLITQNGQYDRLCLEQKFGFTIPWGPPRAFDSILAHHIVASYLPHGLDLLTSVYTDMPYYKKTEEGDAWSTSSDRELHVYCLRGDVRVVMADGTHRRVSDLVRSRAREKVLSMSPEGKMEARAITGWYRNRVKGQKWIQIVTEAHCTDGMTLTPDHKVWVKHRGWVEAQEVHVGDELALPEELLTVHQFSALMGTLVGDSTLAVSPAFRTCREIAPTAYIQGNHRADTNLSQEKVRLLGPVAMLDPVRKGGVVRVKGRIGLGQPSQPWRTKNLAQLAPLLPHLRDITGQRRLSLAMVQRMGPVGWAWWFMDDGCRQNGQRRPKNTGARGGRAFKPDSVVLSTQRYPRADVEAVAEWMRDRFGAMSVGRDGVIRLGSKASVNFCREIAPFILPAQRYKLPREGNWKSYRDFNTRATRNPVYSRVQAVRDWNPNRATRMVTHRADTRWCLDVEGNHNFFTQYGLVHNCLRDCEATWLSAKKLKLEIAERAADVRLYKHDARQEHECEEWKRAGIEVDLEAMLLFRQHYQGVEAKALKLMKEVVLRTMAKKNKGVKPVGVKPLLPPLPASVAALEAIVGESGKEARGSRQKTPSKELTRQGQRAIAEDIASGKVKRASAPLTSLDTLLAKLVAKGDEEEADDIGKTVELFNPGSLIELRQLLIGIGVPLSAETPTGLLSTAEEFLLTAYKEVQTQGVKKNDDRLVFLDALFAWRMAGKIESTYLHPELIPAGYVGVNGTEAQRIHPTFSVHVVPSGRLASKQPNFTNQPASIRGMFIARPGHTLVYIDWDALEMRLGAFLSGDQTFIEDFKKWDARTGPKVHVVNMCAIFGIPFAKGIEDKHPGCYRAAKVFAYACFEKNTKVALLTGPKPISKCVPGNWTWSWDGTRMVSTRIKAVIPKGEKECLRLTARDGMGRRQTVIVTPTHPMMRPDGTYTRVGDLKPGDQLMPFRHYTMRGDHNEFDPYADGDNPHERRWVMDRKIHGPKDWRAKRHTHVVVSIKPAGRHEVWDLSVEHPAQNFPLSTFGTMVHNTAYGAGEATVYEQVRAEMPEMEFGTFKKVFAQYKVFRKRLFEFMGEIVRKGTQNSYLDSAILERRVHFFEKVYGEDSPEASAMQNMPFQSGGADVVELANFRIIDRVVLPMRAKLKTNEVLRQLAQIHDELVFEVPERLAEAFAKKLKAVAEEPPGPAFKSWALPVSLGISKRWKPIKWKCEHCAKALKSKVELDLKKSSPVLSVWTGRCEVCKKETKVVVMKRAELKVVVAEAVPSLKGNEDGPQGEEEAGVEGSNVEAVVAPPLLKRARQA